MPGRDKDGLLRGSVFQGRTLRCGAQNESLSSRDQMDALQHNCQGLHDQLQLSNRGDDRDCAGRSVDHSIKNHDEEMSGHRGALLDSDDHRDGMQHNSNHVGSRAPRNHRDALGDPQDDGKLDNHHSDLCKCVALRNDISHVPHC